jgi:chorismate mutase
MSYVQKGKARNVYIRQNEGSLMDVEHAEMVEKQLDAMIQRRARKGDVDPDEAEEIWKESVRRYNARRREENRREWCGYFERLAASLRARAEEYDHRVQTLMETDQPKGAA